MAPYRRSLTAPASVLQEQEWGSNGVVHIAKTTTVRKSHGNGCGSRGAPLGIFLPRHLPHIQGHCEGGQVATVGNFNSREVGRNEATLVLLEFSPRQVPQDSEERGTLNLARVSTRIPLRILWFDIVRHRIAEGRKSRDCSPLFSPCSRLLASG